MLKAEGNNGLKKPLTLFLILLLAISSSACSLPSTGAEDNGLSSQWKPEEILVDAPLNLNVVFLGGGISPDEEELENRVRSMLPWYAPYVASEEKFLGVNFTEINLNLITAPHEMVEEYAEFIEENKLIFQESSPPVKAVQSYFEQLGTHINSDKIYWVDAWRVEEWLNEKGQEYLGISPDNYTIYFIISATEVEAVVEYYVDTVAPETGVEMASIGMSAFGGLHRLYFIDLTSIPLGKDKCEGASGCKSATPYYYPTLWQEETLEHDNFYNLLSTYITETVIYIFFRGYLWSPRYEINLYEYLLVIDATSHDEASSILENFSYDIFSDAINTLIPYTYSIIEYDLIDIDDYPDLKNILFSTLKKADDYVIVDCSVVPETVLNLDLIKRPKGVRTIVAVLFVFDEEAYVCGKDVVGRAFSKGAISALSAFTLKYEGPSLTLYHEAGHVLGLRHPHDADPIPWGKDLLNWLYDWSATPMTYNSAIALKTQAEGYYFAQMDLDSMDMGVNIYLLNKTRSTVYNALKILEENGLTSRDLPNGLLSLLEEIKEDLDKGVEEFRKYNFFNWSQFYGLKVQKASAFDYFLSSYDKAVTFSEMVEKLLEYLIETKEIKMKLEDLQALKDENAKLRQEIERIKESYNNLQEENRNLQQELEATKSKYQKLEKDYQSLKTSYNQLNQEKNVLAEEVDALKRKIEDVSAMSSLLMLLTIILIAIVIVLIVLLILSRRRMPPPSPPPIVAQL